MNLHWTVEWWNPTEEEWTDPEPVYATNAAEAIEVANQKWEAEVRAGEKYRLTVEVLVAAPPSIALEAA